MFFFFFLASFSRLCRRRSVCSKGVGAGGRGQVRSAKYRLSAGLGGVGLETEHTLLTLAAPLLAPKSRSAVCYLLLAN